MLAAFLCCVCERGCVCFQVWQEFYCFLGIETSSGSGSRNFGKLSEKPNLKLQNFWIKTEYLLDMSTSSADDSTPPSPVAPNAPKFGTLIPNRIFVGGISPNTSESELQSLFANYGRVKATKIILDRAGVSKGYGFVTFETEEEARRIQKESDIILRDRKLNIAPAIKKQIQQLAPEEDDPYHFQMSGISPQLNPQEKPFARGFDSPPLVPNGTILYQNGIPFTYHNGMAFFSVPESFCTYGGPQANYPVIYPSSSVYVPQQPFPCPTATNASYSSMSFPDLTQFVPAQVPTQYYIPTDQNF